MATNLIYSAKNLSALGILLLGLIISFFVFYFTTNAIGYHKKLFLEKEIEQFIKLIELRISAYETILHSLRAVYISHEHNNFQPFTKVHQFDQYVKSITFPEKTPSLKTVVFYRKTEIKNKAHFEQQMRLKYSQEKPVYSKYKIFPETRQAFLLPVEIVSPFATNFGALGYDVYHEKIRREAIHHALYNDFAISNKVILVHTKEPSLLLFVPVYNQIYNKKDLININNLIGVIGSAFSINDFFKEVLNSSIFGNDSLIRVSDTHNQQFNIIYQHPHFKDFINQKNYIYSRKIKEFGGRQWQIEFLIHQNNNNIFTDIYNFVPKIALSFCIIISLIVFILHIRNHQLYESESRFKRIMDVAPLAIAITDLNKSRVILFNQKASELFRYDLINIDNYDPANFYCDINQRHEMMSELNTHRQFSNKEILFRRADNTKFWALCAGTLTHFEAKNVLLISFVDISLRKELEQKLLEFATTDGLTGIFNRRHFLETSRQEILRAYQYQHDLSVIMLDIDHFKRINDTYGHDSGDIVIRKVVEITAKQLKEFDIFGRLGGEEFAIVLPECSQSNAEIVANKIRQMIEVYPFSFEAYHAEYIYITVSLGLVTLQTSELNIDIHHNELVSIEKLLTKADEALYEAKHQGRNQVQIKNI